MKSVLETDDHGDLTIPAEFLCEVAPHTRFLIERRGQKLELEPETSTEMSEGRRLEWAKWLADLDELNILLASDRTSDRSALDILSEMRR